MSASPVIVVFTVLSFLIAIVSLVDHFRQVCHWPIQRLYIRAIWSGPVLGLLSLLSLEFPDGMLLADALLAFYEGYMLYLFYAIVILYCGGKHALGRLIVDHFNVERKTSLAADAPEPDTDASLACQVCRVFTLCTYSAANSVRFLEMLGGLVMQYCIVKALLYVVLFVVVKVCSSPSFSDDGSLEESSCSLDRLTRVMFLVRIFTVTSLVVALSALLNMYHLIHHYLTGFNPIRKFFLIKTLVALVTVQRFVINFATGFDSKASITEELTFGTRLYLALLVFESTAYTLIMALEFRARQLAGSDFKPPPAPHTYGDDADLENEQSRKAERTPSEAASLLGTDNICGRSGCSPSADTDEDQLTIISALWDVVLPWRVFPSHYELDNHATERRPSHSIMPGRPRPVTHKDPDGVEMLDSTNQLGDDL